MMPSELKVGSKVKLNPEFLKVWWQGNGYLPPEIEDQVVEIITVKCRPTGNMESDDPHTYTEFVWKGQEFFMEMTPRGDYFLSDREGCHRYRNVQVYIPISSGQVPGTKYCSCGGSRKENWAGGKKFFVCISCNLEAL
jgi:hypothetical protein